MQQNRFEVTLTYKSRSQICFVYFNLFQFISIHSNSFFYSVSFALTFKGNGFKIKKVSIYLRWRILTKKIKERIQKKVVYIESERAREWRMRRT